MHSTFRTLGQQKGMESIRLTLPEEIDIYLNNQITNKVRQIVAENTTTVYNDKVSVQRNPISPINALRTLYKVERLTNINGSGIKTDPYNVDLTIDDDVMFYTGISIRYSDNDFYACRIIDGEKLEYTLTDYCSRSSWNYPIADFHSGDTNMVVDIYTDSNVSHVASAVDVRYIKKPNVVKYSTDASQRVDCDLPEHLHVDIVTAAVTEYFNAVGSTAQVPE